MVELVPGRTRIPPLFRLRRAPSTRFRLELRSKVSELRLALAETVAVEPLLSRILLSSTDPLIKPAILVGLISYSGATGSSLRGRR